jgi:multiple antibiotic resistance protein
MALFHVVNPIGSGVLFLNLTPNADNKLRRTISRKIALNSLALMLIVLLGGVYILKLFGITIPVVQMCGGFMILTMGWNALANDNDKQASKADDLMKGTVNSDTLYRDQAFYPFTFPFTVGPGSIAVTLTISAETIQNAPGNDLLNYTGAIISIILVALTIYVCYSSADYLLSKMNEQVRMVLMKILSFVLLCIGGQIIFNGLTAFIKNLHTSGVI